MQETSPTLSNERRMTSRTTSPTPSTLNRRISALVIAALILLTIGLNLPGLWDFDEGFYAQISLEMAQANDWVYTTFNGDPRFDKPPLLYWMIRFFYAIVGVNEWAVRLPSALMGAATVGVTALFARRVTSDPQQGWHLGLWSGTILTTSVLFFILARMGMMDVGLTLFVSLALYAYTRTWNQRESGKTLVSSGFADHPIVSWILVGVFTGLGVLMKGPVAAILVGLALIAFTLIDEKLSGLLRLVANPGPWIAVVAAIVVAGPWHVAITLRAGKAFWDRYFGFHQVGLYTSEFQGHGGPWYYHILIMIFSLLPWSAILPWFKRSVFQKSSLIDSRMMRFLWVWLGSTLIFFSASATKAPAYTLPAFPAAALILAWLWISYAQLTGTSSERTPARGSALQTTGKPSANRVARLLSPSLITAVLAVLLVVGVLFVKSQAPPGYEGVADLLIWTPLLLLGISLVGIVLGVLRRGTGAHHLWAAAANAVILAILLALVIIPALDEFKPQRSLAPLGASLAEDLGVSLGSVAGRGGDASARFYARRPVIFLDNLQQAASFLARDERPILLALAEDQAELARRIAQLDLAAEIQNPASQLQVLARAGNGVLLRLVPDDSFI